MLHESDASARHRIGPGLLFTRQVFHLKLHVQMRPSGCQVQEGAQRLGSAKKLVQTGLCTPALAWRARSNCHEHCASASWANVSEAAYVWL